MFDMQFCNCQNGWKNPLKLSADYIHNEFRSYKTTDFDNGLYAFIYIHC